MSSGNQSETNRNWYALHVRSNQERTTSEFLNDRNVEHFFPTYNLVSKRSDRRVTLTKPLFTGYVFVRVNYNRPERVESLKAPGAVRFVGFGNQPSPIDDEVIESLKILLGGDDNTIRPHPLVQVGNRVRVTDGPFAGATGVLSETKSRNPSLVVEIEFLGRAVAVPISRDQVTPHFE